MLSRYRPIWVHESVGSGLSLTFFPHVGQKNADGSMGVEQKGQYCWVDGVSSTSVSYHKKGHVSLYMSILRERDIASDLIYGYGTMPHIILFRLLL